ncbi:hypothetical protein L596_023466 [Steinernema carpocapsae]|uniref:Uncharacterized protein n=1 Tax=Steinernema carpocapsae TaxID=34508 RepID=A0A4U5MDQ3_STECR|nr:hypothetical protein L596_023466 [Steinernema carpocapsae]
MVLRYLFVVARRREKANSRQCKKASDRRTTGDDSPRQRPEADGKRGRHLQDLIKPHTDFPTPKFCIEEPEEEDLICRGDVTEEL